MAVTFTEAERMCLLAFYRMAQTVDSEDRNREAMFLRDRSAVTKCALGKLTSAAAIKDASPPPTPPSMIKRAQTAVIEAKAASALAASDARHNDHLSRIAPNGFVEEPEVSFSDETEEQGTME